MISFGFENYRRTAQGGHRLDMSGRAEQAGVSYGWNYWFPYLGAVERHRYRLDTASDLLARGEPFIFPVELRYEIIEHLSSADTSHFLDPYVPPAVLAGIKAGQVTLVISFAHEARQFFYMRSPEQQVRNVYDDIADFVRRHGLAPRQVWLLTGNIHFEGELNHWRAFRQIASLPFQVRYADIFCPLMKGIRRVGIEGETYRIQAELAPAATGGVSCRSVEIFKAGVPASVQDFYGRADVIRAKEPSDRLFLCMNNAPRTHRVLALVMMALGGHLDQSLVSLNIQHPERIRYEDPTVQHAWEMVQQRMPLRVDDAPLVDAALQLNGTTRFDNSTMIGIHDDRPYRRVRYNVVTETAYDNGFCFISEKTWKAIMACRPFIIIGTPHTLRFLRSRGYQTFNDLFDESYDDLVEFGDRIIRIGQTMGAMAALDPVEVQGRFNEILRHNLRIFVDQPSDLEKVLSEIAAGWH